MEEELEFHLQQAIDRNLARGMDPGRAYMVTVWEVQNINGLGGGGGETTVTWEPPPPPEGAAPDTGAVRPDTSAARPDTGAFLPWSRQR